jgi:hypothetical protein
MGNTYRGRLVSKNQMTIPVVMQQELNMVQGDELEFVLDQGKVASVHVLKAVRVELLSDDVLQSLKQRKAKEGPQRQVSQQDVKELSEGKKELSESKKVEARAPATAAMGD